LFTYYGDKENPAPDTPFVKMAMSSPEKIAPVTNFRDQWGKFSRREFEEEPEPCSLDSAELKSIKKILVR